MKFPCGICKKSCGGDSIECSSCSKWIHRRCVPLTTLQLTDWGQDNLYFVCRKCAFTGGSYDTRAALKRVLHASTAKNADVRVCAASEMKLLETYGISLPKIDLAAADDLSDKERDLCSIKILKKFHPIMLETTTPLRVVGDGNCLFRAVSLGVYGHQNHHLQLRLRTALEMALHPRYYDSSLSDYEDLVKDNRLVHDPYTSLLSTVATEGAYSEIMVMFALSAVLSVGLESYCPPTRRALFLSEPLCRHVYGRSVRQSRSPVTTVMWTMTQLPSRSREFRPNHFAILKELNKETVKVDLTRPEKEDKTKKLKPKSKTKDCVIISDSDDDGDSDIGGDGHGDCDSSSDEVTVLQDLSKETYPNADGDGDAAASTDDDDDGDGDGDGDTSTDQNADGGQDLPLGPKGRRYLDVTEVVSLLRNSEAALKYVPRGKKENKVFIVENRENLTRRQNKKKSKYWDDCGAWGSKGVTNKTLYCEQPDGNLMKVVLREDKYCLQRREDKKTVYRPVIPQPQHESIVIIYRYYTQHTLKNSYEKRVTWCAGAVSCTYACYEYKGTCPEGALPGEIHRAKYQRTKPHVMKKMKEELKSKRPKDVYRDADMVEGARNIKQVRDMHYRLRKEEGKSTGGTFADQVAQLEEQHWESDFIRFLFRRPRKVPCAILYTDEQLADLKRFCGPASTAESTVLGVDKTFNLGDLHVTVTVFKNLAVTRRTTTDHPLMIGPIFLHGDSDQDTYFEFFHHLAGKLKESCSRITIGSDEEKAIRGAILQAMPLAKRISCVRHLRNNTLRHLADKVGMDSRTRSSTLAKLFGKGGLIDAGDQLTYELRWEKILKGNRHKYPEFVGYLEKTLGPVLQENFETCKETRTNMRWTNNNCESINHVLKQATEWKGQKLPKLVKTLQDLVKGQYREVQRSLLGIGDYLLCKEFTKFCVAQDRWLSMQPKSQKRHFSAFLETSKEHPRIARSQSGMKMAQTPTNPGKKPGQTKRRRNAKTSNTKKTKLH